MQAAYAREKRRRLAARVEAGTVGFMRKRFFLWLAVAGGLTAARLAAAFTVSGEIPAAAGAPVTVLRESLEARNTTPVASVTADAQGRFVLTVEAEAGLFKLEAGALALPFVAAAGQTLRAEGATPQVRGSRDQDLFLAYEAFRTASLARTVLPVRAALRAANASGGTSAEIERLNEQEIAAYDGHRRELNDFTLDNLGGSAALYAASLRWDGAYRLEELTAQGRAFAAAQPGLEISRLIEERLARFAATSLGAEAPDLAGPTPDGGRLALAELRGKVVLVDFWASWCPPCRFENRHYAALYERFKDAGFEILAVSVDHNGPAWKAAIAKDGATWRHISDLTGWKTPLAAAYNVAALPSSFLLDAQGRIVAKNLRGPELAAKLSQLLGAAAAPAAPRR